MISMMIEYNGNTRTVVLKLYPASESSGGPLKYRLLGPSNLGWGRPENVHF